VASLGFGTLPVWSADAAPYTPWFQVYDPYVTVYGGASLLDDDDAMRAPYDEPGNNFHSNTNTGFVLGAAYGVRLNNYLRTEAELSYARSTHDFVDTFQCPAADKKCKWQQSVVQQKVGSGGTTNSINAFANAWVDIQLISQLSVYGGGGLGFAVLAYEDSSFNVDQIDVTYAWQIGGGARWQFADSMLLDVAYRWRGPIDLDYGPVVPSDFELFAHQYTLGLTYGF